MMRGKVKLLQPSGVIPNELNTVWNVACNNFVD